MNQVTYLLGPLLSRNRASGLVKSTLEISLSTLPPAPLITKLLALKHDLVTLQWAEKVVFFPFVLLQGQVVLVRFCDSGQEVSRIESSWTYKSPSVSQGLGLDHKGSIPKKDFTPGNTSPGLNYAPNQAS